MSSPRWAPTALASFDVWRVVVAGTWLATEHLTVTVNGKSCVLTIGATVTTASIATALAAMWNGTTATGDATRSEVGSNIAEFKEATATIGATTSTVLFTMNTAGIPLIMSASTDSGSGTVTLTNPTVASGPNFFNNALNWTTGSVPVSTDTIYYDNSSVPCLYGLDQSAVVPAAMYVALSYTGTIGLPEINQAGGYHEYRSTYLSLGPVILQIGTGAGNGSGRIKINTGSTVCALTVFASGSPADEKPAIICKGTHASNALVMSGGTLGVALFGAEVATLATVTKNAGDLTTGAGVTLSGALKNDGGTWVANSAIATSLTITNGTVTLNGTGAVAQLTIDGGTVVYNSTGTLGGATVVGGSGVLDFSGNSVATTITNPVDLFGQASFFIDPNKRTGAVVIDLNRGSTLAQVNLGPNIRVSRGTPS